MNNQKCIAMLLAGGQGSRLKNLTVNNAKPGVMFGGKYRIIDFSLSNCFHSDIFTVGVLTQYKPLLLNRYIGNGSSWALDKIDQGVYILPPYVDKQGGNWYFGTADAVYQNLAFMDMYNPEYVLILSGDHIYKMDYAKMLKYTIEKDADLTVSVMEVEWEEASRFGITNLGEDMRIVTFDEKPEKPKNNMASMGIYIFRWSILREALIRDANDESSDHDFGKNIIPMLLNENKSIFAYLFEGYWRDVGTIESYYKANMDLLSDSKEFDLSSKEMRIYSNNRNSQPHYIGECANIDNSLICDGCLIEGHVTHSILSYDVTVGKNAVIKDSILFNKVVVEEGAVIEKAIIGENIRIEKNKKIGNENSEEIIVIA
ncbi:MAG: glucose-1-phosphate adenylyltransferase [Tissierellales bacterium]|jgi:glucose-1-phosphate adenylyltransferase|nr:glucose-1-phosphate adenylyltransferase [Tissierellales bacterium]MBN2827243.1 glucose-1-phosphate adenylyltransferase [Tissierellales bacterium]